MGGRRLRHRPGDPVRDQGVGPVASLEGSQLRDGHAGRRDRTPCTPLRSRTLARMLGTDAPFNTPWLPSGYGQKLWKAAYWLAAVCVARLWSVPKPRTPSVLSH